MKINLQALQAEPIAAQDARKRRGIVTTHNGVRYRSRLEARWSEFFRLLGWTAFYEPFDLDGYIPDFVLHGRSERILVEVKPVSGEKDPLFKETAAKIERSGWKHDALIVSYFMPITEVFSDSTPCAGWLGEYSTHYITDEDDFNWALAPFTEGIDGLGFCHEYQSYCNRITDEHESGYSICRGSKQLIEKHWRDAGNAVQWRAP